MPDVPLPPPWDACAASFLQSIYDHSGSRDSLENYTYTLRAFFRDPLRAPDSYTRSEVEAFLVGRSQSNRNKGAPVTASTRNSRLKILRSFYAYSAAYLVNGAPLLQGIPPTYRIPYLKVHTTPRAFSAAEIEKLFAAIDTSTVKGCRDRAIMLTYFLTAKRRSEIARLTVGDIQEATLIEQDGTRREGYIFQYRAKGRSRELLTAELPSLAYAAIQHYWRVSGRLDSLKPEDPVFTAIKPGMGRRDRAGNQPLRGDHLNTLLKTYCKKAGLDPRYSLHSLRHGSARIRYELGSDIRAVQDALGHSNLATTSLYLQSLVTTGDSGADLLTKRFEHLGR